MPTFPDPILDGAETSAALRSLAHATRDLPHPGETYAVIGDLLGAVRSLRQVLDQLAAPHLRFRACAHDDAGDHRAGVGEATAAADELHQASTLLDQVESRLDHASQHSGRIAWHEAPHTFSAVMGRAASRPDGLADPFTRPDPRPDRGRPGRSL
jgi:hypothetical protein